MSGPCAPDVFLRSHSQEKLRLVAMARPSFASTDVDTWPEGHQTLGERAAARGEVTTL